ncbi:hypothetical protein AMJ39_00975 [candidate division TA06 bacterium DG_24]|uniref:Glycosyltransferase subfamily 4-like N-terminal domain-containing protein n=3 Tax=Bacteria division TA06 TaxID=1156500 RepID=A0A0S8JP77_UNCT6|nr:MAG: hypothetical protein AMJ39_00975 [candidate division TA06 bacterium DG_24]KPK71667.1 MAG: hypothetical protein AMJ82_00190 [candidate division TA06 bacterium SM23_40]KPL11559.1 MAG: hypothetical protein AMJ71_00255 [candidate division TA06 bacterium SM1_40]
MATGIRIVVYLLGEWEHFHRRPMLEALARSGLGCANLLCVSPPRSLRHLLRGSARTNRGVGQPFHQRIAPNIFLTRPYIWLPFVGRRGRRNRTWRSIVERQVRWALSLVGGADDPVVAWMYRPDQVYNLGMAGEEFVVYECFDEYRLNYWDGIAIPEVAAMEAALLERVDLVFATARSLIEDRRREGLRIEYAPNGVDFQNVARAADPNTSLPEEIRHVPRPRLGYVGRLSDALDLELLEGLSRTRPDWSFVFVGPIDGTTEEKLAPFRGRANLHVLGAKRRDDLVGYLRAFDVGLIPYKRNGFNKHRNPLKLWEYLAAGLPVVSTPLHELEDMRDVVWIADGIDEFRRAIGSAIAECSQAGRQRRMAVARDHSWDRLAGRMLQTLSSVLGEKRAGRNLCGEGRVGQVPPSHHGLARGGDRSIPSVPWPYDVEPAPYSPEPVRGTAGAGGINQ